jgi:ABC-type Fe3+-hydroxamate transport system substrate-binding protein
MRVFPPRRIVCLTEETVETPYLLGKDARIVGVSGYAVRPARVRREKPRVSAFISADTGKIRALEPDLVFTFRSDAKPVPTFADRALERFAARPGFDRLPAVRTGFVREIKSALILRPGPATLTDGLDALARDQQKWVPVLRPIAR